jgi:hypothetical protein
MVTSSLSLWAWDAGSPLFYILRLGGAHPILKHRLDHSYDHS